MAIQDILITIRASYQQVVGALNQISAQVSRVQASTRLLDVQFRNVDRTLKYIALGSGIAMVGTLGKMASELQLLELRIATFNRDLSSVPATMDKLVEIARNAPFSIKALSDAFIKLKASGIDPLSSREGGKNAIEIIADSVAAFGGSSDVFERAILAISQMAGKGVVSMEELRQQLGEAIPVALRAMAEGLGISVSQLIREVSRGQIEFERGFNAMLSVLQRTTGGAGALMKGTITGALQQSRVEIEKLLLALNRSGALDYITAAIQSANNWFSKLTDKVTEFGNNSDKVNQVADSIQKIGEYALTAATPVVNLFAAIKTIINALVEGGAGLPPEMVGGGILGFVLFGKTGIIAGALAGLISDQLLGIVEVIVAAMQGLVEATKALGVEDVAAMGLLGYLIFGKLGVMAVIVTKIVDVVITGVRDIIYNIDRFTQQLFGSIGAGLDALSRLEFKGIGDKMAEGWKKAGAEFDIMVAKANKNKDFFRYGNLDKSVLGDLLDTIRGPKAEEASKTVSNLREQLKGLVDSMRNSRQTVISGMEALKEIGGLDDKSVQTLDKLNKSFTNLELKIQGGGNERATALAKYNAQLGQMAGIIDTVEKKINALPADDNRRVGLQKELATLKETAAGWQSLVTQFQNLPEKGGASAERSMLKVTHVLADMNRQLDQIENQVGGSFDPIKRAGDEAADKFEKLREKLAEYTLQVQQAKIAGAQKKVILEGIAETAQRLNDIETRAIALAKEKAQWQIDDAVRTATQSARQEEFNLRILQMENNFNEAGTAVERAKMQVTQSLEGIQQKIREIERNMRSKGGLIPDDIAQASIARLREVYAQMEEAGAKFIERVQFESSNWGKMWMEIANTIESSFGDVFYAVITGTKSAKQALLDFYNAITKAVIQYLVKQAMVGVFGQGGGSGGGFASILGNLFTPFGSGGLFGGLFGFAGGGSFVVGGHGGTDTVPIGFMATPGERVTVETPGQQARTSGGDSYMINIHAIDARGVAELFMRNGSSLISSLRQRERLGKGATA